MATTNAFHLLVEDVLTASAIHRYTKSAQLTMLALAVGMTLALEQPEWAREVLDAVSEKPVDVGRRAAAMRYAEIVGG